MRRGFRPPHGLNARYVAKASPDWRHNAVFQPQGRHQNDRVRDAGTNDLPRAAAFYDVLLGEIGAKRLFDSERGIGWGVAMDKPSLAIMKPFDGKPATVGNGVMAAIVVDSREKVERVHGKALALGAKDEGAVDRAATASTAATSATSTATSSTSSSWASDLARRFPVTGRRRAARARRRRARRAPARTATPSPAAAPRSRSR